MERKVYCLNKISKVGLGVLPSNYNVVEELEGSDAVLVRSAAMHEMDLPESVKCVARAGGGLLQKGHGRLGASLEARFRPFRNRICTCRTSARRRWKKAR